MVSTAVCMALLVPHHRPACQVAIGIRAEVGACMLTAVLWHACLAHACSHHRGTVSACVCRSAARLLLTLVSCTAAQATE